MWVWCTRACALAALSAQSGCSNTDANQSTLPVVLGMTDKSIPVYQDPQLTLYEVQVPVRLPIRAPNDQERAALGGAQAPYPHTPFLLDSDETVEIHFTLTNLDDQRHAVWLLLDPWNEFVRYHPGVQVINDETTLPNISGYQKPFLLDGKTRLEGTITSDDTHELAIDLATAMAIMSKKPDPNAAFDQVTLLNHVFDLQNRSNDGDPLVTPLIPQVIAGLTGFDLGLRADSAMSVAVEITVDITDQNGNRILAPGATDKPMGEPSVVLKPPASR